MQLPTPPDTPRTDRRAALLALAGLSAGLGATVTACAAPEPTPPPQRLGLSVEDQALQYKFRGIPKGGELRVDATFDTQGRQVVTLPSGGLFGPAMGGIARGGRTSGYFGDEKYGLPLPKSLRYQRFADDAPRWNNHYSRGPMFKGPFVVDVTVPVASRIPDAVLDRIRQYHGSLKLKLRFTRETLLVGWQIMNGKSYPWKRDQNGRAYATDEDVMIGGDFCEKQIIYRMINGKVQQIRRNGWQIDPKTGQKVETDF